MVAVIMLPVQLVTSLPQYLLAQAEQSVRATSVAIARSLQPDPPNRALPPGVVDDNAPTLQSGTPGLLRFESLTPSDADFLRTRAFEEPLVPTEAKAAPGESRALAAALIDFSQTSVSGKEPAQSAEAIRRFLSEYPASRWAMSLWLNLGLTYRKTGYWTRALDAWEQAWKLGKTATHPAAQALANRAVGELAELNARLGRFERLTPLFDEIATAKREPRGVAAEKLSRARQGLWMMDNQPGIAFRCGPMALNSLRLADDPKAPMEPKIFNAQSTRQGISLSQVAALSRDIGRPMQMALRKTDKNGKGADFITPAVVHWKAGHYAALVEQKDGRYRVDDPTFGDTLWVSRAALEAETDGYFLVAEKLTLPAGWKALTEAEGGKVWGKGATGTRNPNATKDTDARAKACPPVPPGMAAYNVESMLTSLTMGDTPLSYQPPRGPAINFSVEYSQHEASQPTAPNFWNLGPKWTSKWLSYIEDNGTDTWVLLGYYPVQQSNGSITYYPIYTQEGGVATGPLPITHLAGGGVENYQALTQINNFAPPGDPTPSIYFSFAAQEQTVSYQQVPDSGYQAPTWYDSSGGVHTLAPPSRPFLVHPRLVQTADTAYKRYLPDGTIETYHHSDHASSYPRRIFLSQRADPSGNTIHFSYDSQNRLLAVTDALGQVTTLSYESSDDPLKVTRVTDPFGRTCALDYNAQGLLQTITDTVGIQSQFGYKPGSDFINALTTPYGTTTFTFGDVTTDPTLGTRAWLEATDPYGDVERFEYRHSTPGIPYAENAPQGIPVYDAFIESRNTYYWDKKAYKEAKQADGTFDYTLAQISHFLHDVDTNVTSGTLESTKAPLESRVWLFYQGQSSPGFGNYGMSTSPSLVARVLDDGSTQLSRYQYNDQQRVTKATDPLGRETTYDYAANGLDLLAVRRTTQGLNERLFAATYNAAHQPLTTTDASGQTSTLSYNGFGQVATVTDATNRTATLQYDAQGYLQEIDGYDPALKSTFTYDGFGRLASTTAYPDAYTVQLGYDAVGGDPLRTLNRATTVTYPDGSYTEVDYTRLDAEWLRDRGGNWSRLLTNQLRQTVASIDPLGQVTEYGYCLCGQLVRLTDPSGHVTQWKLDAAARPIAKVYADGTETDYAYEATTSRLASVTDAKGQQTRYAYQLDGALASVAYLHAEHATPGVSYAYDGLRGRLASVTDGIGTTTYGYYGLEDGSHPVLGAGRLQSVSGPFPNQSSLYEYDALGRTVKTTVDGQESTLAFDALGRLESETNALGSFAYGYDGVTGRVASVSLPNGGQTLYAYAPDNAQERRLVQIKHLRPGGATLLDQFDYGYEGPQGRIAHWGQQQPGPGSGAGLASHAYDLRYDAVGQLRQATLDGDEASPGSGGWRYDAAGNRTGIQAGGGTLSTAVPTATNALFSLRGGGKVRVAGSLSEWAQVTVNGQAASPAAGGPSFEAFVALPAGSQTLTVEATDASGNVGTSRYQLAITAGAGLDFGYDENGNTTALTPEAAGGGAPPAQSFEWDACDRVVAINQGSHRTELGYDGQGNRVRLTEREGGAVTSDRLYVDNEERDAATGAVRRRFFAQGEQRVGGADEGSYFYARDHLGSVREMTDSAGAVRASYGYGVWGERTRLRGNLETEAGFTGYWHHAPSGLELSPTRPYAVMLGRFISQDPIQESGGMNLYRYCSNDPLNLVDPLGLDNIIFFKPGTSEYYAALQHNSTPVGDISLAAHGAVQSLSDNRGDTEISPSVRTIGDEIKRYKKFDNTKRLWLNACYSGSHTNEFIKGHEANNIAQDLANYLNMIVIAPDGYVNWNTGSESTGYYMKSVTLDPGTRYRVFYPHRK